MTTTTFGSFEIEPLGQSVAVHVQLQQPTTCVGWQFYDPDTNRFIMEGEWVPVSPGASDVSFTIPFPPEPGAYRVYISPRDDDRGWAYQHGEQFLMIDVAVENETAQMKGQRLTTTAALGRRRLKNVLPRLFLDPVRGIFSNRKLIASMARRDILARYRGSFGGVFWTVLNPLILMGTYFFVFGVVLHGSGQNRTGFALYFLSGMLPWLAFSEAVGRSPYVIVEHRSFVKKLIFPLEILPVNYLLAGLITEVFATGIFLIILLALRGAIPLTALWLPVVVVPQVLLTLGICWFLAALGVFFRDLGQIMGFGLTLWFFVTPICYPESSLPKALLPVLGKNPMFVLVHAYRACLLEGHAPDALALSKLLLLALVLFFAGHAFFYKLRKHFADVL
ncbi:MAG TPA: ABC transporter permease [Bryobacteraceae bacterium]|nr:ABC transporter permease [Bryobacteraceae bacterium]